MVWARAKKVITQTVGVEGCVEHIVHIYIYVCICIYKLHLCMHTNCGAYKLFNSKARRPNYSHYSFQQGDGLSHKVLVTCSSVGMSQCSSTSYRKNVDLSMMKKHWGLDQCKIRSQILQFFSVLIQFDSRHAKPPTAQCAAWNFMMLTLFPSKSEAHFAFQNIVLEADLAFIEVNRDVLIFNCPRSGSHWTHTYFEQKGKQCNEENVVANLFLKNVLLGWYGMRSRRS